MKWIINVVNGINKITKWFKFVNALKVGLEAFSEELQKQGLTDEKNNK